MNCPACGRKMPKATGLKFAKPVKRERKTRWRNGHEYLVGVLAHALRRKEVYERAGGQVILHMEDAETVHHSENVKDAMCQGCEVPHPVSWYYGEWHHIKGGRGPQHCDCLHNALWVCKEWHRQHHGRLVGGRDLRKDLHTPSR